MTLAQIIMASDQDCSQLVSGLRHSGTLGMLGRFICSLYQDSDLQPLDLLGTTTYQDLNLQPLGLFDSPYQDLNLQNLGLFCLILPGFEPSTTGFICFTLPRFEP